MIQNAPVVSSFLLLFYLGGVAGRRSFRSNPSFTPFPIVALAFWRELVPPTTRR